MHFDHTFGAKSWRKPPVFLQVVGGPIGSFMWAAVQVFRAGFVWVSCRFHAGFRRFHAVFVQISAGRSPLGRGVSQSSPRSGPSLIDHPIITINPLGYVPSPLHVFKTCKGLGTYGDELPNSG